MSFDGTWVVEIATPIGKQTVTLDILDREGQLAGTATRDGECVPFEDVTRDGNRL